MRVLVIIFISFFSTTIFARDIELSYSINGKRYELKVDKSEIELRSYFSNLKMEKKVCNKLIFDQFVTNLNNTFKTISISKDKKVIIPVNYNGEKLNIIKESRLGSFLKNIDKRMTHLLIREKNNCG